MDEKRTYLVGPSGIYGAMALAGKFICSITGIDATGGFHLSLGAILDGLGYAAPPIMALLFILDVCRIIPLCLLARPNSKLNLFII